MKSRLNPTVGVKCLAGLLITLLALTVSAVTITDPFTNAANWAPPFTESGKNMVVSNGRMNFTSSTTVGGGAGTVRTAPFLTLTQSWSIKVDVHVDPFVITDEAQGVSVFLGVGKTSDYLGTHLILGFDRDAFDPNYYGVNDDVQTNGVSVAGMFNVNFLPSPDATLRLDYSTTNQSITYYCDYDGSAGGSGWTLLGTASIASGSYNLHLGPTDTLSVILAGWSGLQTVVAGQAYLDNLEITVVETGSLQVTISPTNAVSAGAQWQVDGGAWQNHSNTVSGLSVGNHTVAYKSVSGWNTPGNQTVTISPNLTTTTNATYIQQAGALLVTISPAEAANAGAQWRVDGGPWQNSGGVVAGLSPGYHTVNFSSIPNWYAPWDQMVFVVTNSTTTANGVYTAVGQPVIPAAILCSLQGNSLTLSYPVLPGQLCILQYTDDLTPPVTWRPFAPFIPPLAVATAGSPRRYFRVRIGDSFPAVYSLNIVGYVRRVMQPGLNLVANPLNSCGGNAIANLFPSCPQNSEIWLPDSNGSLNPGSMFSGGSWDLPNMNLQPGQGVGFVNPAAAFEVTFAGEVAAGSLTRAIPSGISLVGSILPVNGLLNFPAQQDDEITRWNATNQTSTSYSFLSGAWQAASPPITPAEAFWVQVSQFKQWTQPFEWWNDQEVWEFPLITGHPQNQTKITGTTASFTVSALGSPTLNYQWRKNGTNLLNSERIFGVNSSTLALTGIQPADAGNYTVIITNTFGSAISDVAVLTVSQSPPQIVTTNGSLGLSNGVFGFQLTGLQGQTLIIEGSSNLTTWVGLQTNLLTSGSMFFSDPQWTNFPRRYYRVRSQ